MKAKKLLAVLLAVLCIFSSFATVASASTDTGIVDLIGSEKEDSEPLIYYVKLNVEESDVQALYTPILQISLGGPGWVQLADDEPLAINHVFKAWVDEDSGKQYLTGDKVYVDGEIELTAIWVEKTDDVPELIRTIQCAFEAFGKYIQKFLGIIDKMKEIAGELPEVPGEGTDTNTDPDTTPDTNPDTTPDTDPEVNPDTNADTTPDVA